MKAPANLVRAAGEGVEDRDLPGGPLEPVTVDGPRPFEAAGTSRRGWGRCRTARCSSCRCATTVSCAAGDHVAFQVDADDPDGDDLTYAADGLPPGLDIDRATGEITGTIEEGAEAGSPYTVDITVTDPDGAAATTSFQWTVNPAETAPVTVEVDILPCCIVNDGHGVIPVVIFGSDAVAADQIDPATVRLEGMPVRRLFRWFMAFVHDVDGDGIDDLLVLIDDVAGAIPAGATTAGVTGRLYDGTAIEGADDVCVLHRRGWHKLRSACAPGELR